MEPPMSIYATALWMHETHSTFLPLQACGRKPAFKRNKFGLSAGAPIHKDKTFVFADYQGVRENLGLSEVDQVPSLNARMGILCDPSSPDCSKTTTVAVSPSVQPYLNFYPKPNGPSVCAQPDG